jgi:hypothetical protein
LLQQAGGQPAHSAPPHPTLLYPDHPASQTLVIHEVILQWHYDL